MPKPSTRQKTMLKLLFGGSLLAFIFWQADWAGVAEVMRGISLFWISILLLLSFVLIFVSCLKWQLFLKVQGNAVSVWRLMALYFIGYFFNNFAPSNVGGDVARGLLLGNRIESQSRAFSTVFLERFTGLLALIGMALVSTLLRPELLAQPALLLVLLGMAALFAGFTILLISARAQALTLKLVDRLPGKPVVRKLRTLIVSVYEFRRHPRVLWLSMGYSLLFHALTVVNTQAACLALGLEADLLTLAVVVPVVLIIAIVPLSVNALGIMEGAFVVFLAYAGLDAAEALSVALVLRVKGFALGLLGGLLFLLSQRRAPTESAV